MQQHLYICSNIYISIATFIYMQQHLYICSNIYISIATFIYMQQHLYICSNIYISAAAFMYYSSIYKYSVILNIAIFTNFETDGVP